MSGAAPVSRRPLARTYGSKPRRHPAPRVESTERVPAIDLDEISSVSPIQQRSPTHEDVEVLSMLSKRKRQAEVREASPGDITTTEVASPVSEEITPSPPKQRMIDRMGGRKASSSGSSPASSPLSSPQKYRKQSFTALSPSKSREVEVSQNQSTMEVDAMPRSRGGSPLKRTYGKQSSFLQQEDPLLQPVASTSSSKLMSAKLKESYDDYRRRAEEDQDDLTGVEESQTAMNTFAELQSQGEMRRLSDELSYLVEGLDPSEAVDVRRSSALEIARKAVDPAIVRQMVALDQLEALFDALVDARANINDRVLDLCFALTTCLLLGDRRAADSLSSRHVTALCDLLDRPWASEVISASADVKWAYKGEKQEWSEIATLIVAGKLDNAEAGSSIRLLVLTSLSVIAERQPSGPAAKALSGLAPLVVQLFDSLAGALPQQEKGKRALDNARQLDLRSLAACLRIVEAIPSLSEIWDASGETLEAARDIACTISVLHAVASTDSGMAQTAMDCLLALLRWLITRTSASPKWAITLTRSDVGIFYPLLRLLVATRRPPSPPEPIQTLTPPSSIDGEATPISLDIVLLSLGLLVQLLEGSTKASDSLRTTNIAEKCGAGRACIRKCKCTEARSAVHLLTTIFVEHMVDMDEDNENAVFLRSYLTMLLSLMALSNDTNRTLISEDLAGHYKASNLLKEAVGEVLKEQRAAARSGLPIDEHLVTQAEEVIRTLQL